MSYETLKVRFQDSICFVQIDRPQANNTINDKLIAECLDVLAACEEQATVVVLSGTPEVFCFGGDFQGIRDDAALGRRDEIGPEGLYKLWLKLAEGPFVTISHVRGRANAGGIGFVAASDIVLADRTAQFSLSEMLFGLFPACVLPFLVRRIGFQKAHYMTLMTQPVSAEQALAWGLADACDAQSDELLRKHLLRLRRLSKTAIRRYKQYASKLHGSLHSLQPAAIEANKEVFGDPKNIEAIVRYVEQGLFPWEG